SAPPKVPFISTTLTSGLRTTPAANSTASPWSAPSPKRSSTGTPSRALLPTPSSCYSAPHDAAIHPALHPAPASRALPPTGQRIRLVQALRQDQQLRVSLLAGLGSGQCLGPDP